MGGDGNICLQRLDDIKMFTFFRTVVETLGRAGLYVMTKGVRLSCCSVAVVSKFLDVGPGRGMIRARLISFFKKVAAVSS